MQTPGPAVAEKILDVGGARMILAAARSAGRKVLTTRESKAILNAFHIPPRRQFWRVVPMKPCWRPSH